MLLPPRHSRRSTKCKPWSTIIAKSRLSLRDRAAYAIASKAGKPTLIGSGRSSTPNRAFTASAMRWA